MIFVTDEVKHSIGINQNFNCKNTILHYAFVEKAHQKKSYCKIQNFKLKI